MIDLSYFINSIGMVDIDLIAQFFTSNHRKDNDIIQVNLDNFFVMMTILSSWTRIIGCKRGTILSVMKLCGKQTLISIATFKIGGVPLFVGLQCIVWLKNIISLEGM